MRRQLSALAHAAASLPPAGEGLPGAARAASAISGLPLAGKRGAVFGFASPRSLACAIAEAWARAGCGGERLTVGIQSERFRPALDKASRAWPGGPPRVVVCDVGDDASLAAAWAEIGDGCGAGGLQLLAHSIAHASAPAMRGAVLETSRADFAAAHDASAYSLIALARGAAPLMARGGAGGSIVSLSFLGAQRCVPEYKVMGAAKASLEAVSRALAVELGPALGVRANVISAGPVDTLAARGIPRFRELKDATDARLPVARGRGVAGADVGALAAFLASDAAAAITGQVLYVDGGYSALA
jgi:enoyl-[acyl-carrier protein] reductase I